MKQDLKIKLVDFEDGIACPGFRRISASVKLKYPQAKTYIYNVSNVSVQAFNILSSDMSKKITLNEKFLNDISDSDIVAFSGMSKFSEYIKKSASFIRKRNAKTIIVWGGIHATVFPEDAISHADAVCVGEGEKSFLSFLEKVSKEESIKESAGFWIRDKGKVIKNPLLPLMTSEELSCQPFQDYSFEINHVTHHNIEPMTKDAYISQQGTKYMTLWSLGCPFNCTYCSNSKFLKNSSEYGKIRYARPEYLINEIRTVLKYHDYVNYIELEDDNIFLINLPDLEKFAFLYKKEINLPLFLPGLHPKFVESKKLSLLIEAGLKKVRMGIQSGCQSTLDFYRRKTSLQEILKATNTISYFYPKIMPPFYDVIIDNPIETEEDRKETLSFLRKLKRPFFLYVYSLRKIPGTELWDFAQNNPQYDFMGIEHTYQSIRDKSMAFMVYFLALFNPSDFVYNVFCKISKIKILNLMTFNILVLFYMAKRFFYEIKIGNYQPIAMISTRLAVLLIKEKNSLYAKRAKRQTAL